MKLFRARYVPGRRRPRWLQLGSGCFFPACRSRRTDYRCCAVAQWQHVGAPIPDTAEILASLPSLIGAPRVQGCGLRAGKRAPGGGGFGSSRRYHQTWTTDWPGCSIKCANMVGDLSQTKRRVSMSILLGRLWNQAQIVSADCFHH